VSIVKLSTTQPTLSLPQKDSSHSFETFLNRYWIIFFAVIYGVFVGLPFLAPVMMNAGLYPAGRVIFFMPPAT
jgi:hypothetical protein